MQSILFLRVAGAAAGSAAIKNFLKFFIRKQYDTSGCLKMHRIFFARISCLDACKRATSLLLLAASLLADQQFVNLLRSMLEAKAFCGALPPAEPVVYVTYKNGVRIGHRRATAFKI